ncbi:MAG: sulfatase [Verrucomicrobiales bacterium]|nr:sulfatase [Verrucomicrobiales bacterium]
MKYLLPFLFLSSIALAQAAAPNIVVIYADDLGYGDLSCYGSKVIATPRIDQMAKEGVRFTDFYVASPFCSPSRATLLTGRLPARAGVPYVLFPSEHTGLPASEVTIAETLKPAGYATACVGKWHLGWHKEMRPQQQGFDEFFGLLHTNDTEEWKVGEPFMQLSMFEPLQLRDGDQVVESPVDQAMLTQRYTERAVDFIRRNRERPFFLYLAHTMPHIPQYASPAFVGKSKDGIYGDSIEELDWSTGQVLDALKEFDLDERTLVIFTSDNGANLRGKKPNPKARFPGRSNGGSNGPLRAGKGSTFEGGIRVTCIARWPGKIPAGREDRSIWSTMDFLPTFAELADAKLPEGVTLDGQDASDTLFGNAVNKDRPPLFDYFGVQLQAIRSGQWKLILPITELPTTRVPSLWFEHQPGLFERQHRLWPTATLFNLDDDVGETTDVAAAHPDVVADLLRKAQAFDQKFQKELPPVLYLPGPKQPAPGQIRTPSENIEEWLKLTP